MLREGVSCPPQVANMRFSIHTKRVKGPLFTSRPENLGFRTVASMLWLSYWGFQR
jgi:hypothetical protein